MSGNCQSTHALYGTSDVEYKKPKLYLYVYMKNMKERVKYGINKPINRSGRTGF